MMSAYILSIPTQYAPASSNRRFVTFTNSPLLFKSITWDLCVFRLFSESATISQLLLEGPLHQYFLLYRKWFMPYLHLRINSPPTWAVISLSHSSWRLAEIQGRQKENPCSLVNYKNVIQFLIQINMSLQFTFKFWLSDSTNARIIVTKSPRKKHKQKNHLMSAWEMGVGVVKHPVCIYNTFLSFNSM